MPVYKDEKTNTWYVKSRYKDWTGKTKHLTKRGFALKREAVEWETAFFQRQDASLDMSFGDFYQIYREDMGERLGRRPLRSSTAPMTSPSEKRMAAGPSHGSSMVA